ncbi:MULTISPECIES: YcnI family protein [Brevibacillus]|uniref:YcnI family copper-binding membrane protein n=1 Tax=Brevibacillus TaxID=55080 RepID=UPI00203F3E07|nr:MULTISPECIES: YcnI family protein [Brevibacillus]MCM3080444.1 YcnI family protein [Brevibacillus invocatus]MCM3430634.1 YcnI family protein [Brevibacillus invocatus]MDH4616986.1 YcnI family protein [Brevibacillus sp. AY1]
MKTTKWMSSLLVAGAILTLSSAAQAHVNVYPKETTTGAYEKYTVRVPVEKDVNTVKVKLEFPSGVKVSTVQPVPGWSYEFEKDAEGRNTALIWTATDGGIKAHEFMEFAFVGANPKEAGEVAWKAYQTYTDGEVVEWTGEQDSKTPASVTTIKEGAGAGDGHGHSHGAETAAPAAGSEGTGSDGNSLPLVLSGLALLLSIISFFRKKA